MPITENHVYAVKFCQKLFGKDVCLIGYITFDNPSDVIDLRDIAENLRDWIGVLLNVAQSSAVKNDTVSIEDVTGGVEFATVPWTGEGDIVTESAASFVAAGIKLERGTKITRSGYKRIPGIPEAKIADDTLETAYVNGPLQDIGDAFASQGTINLPNSVTVDFSWLIVGRKEDPPGSKKYVLDLNRVQPITAATVNPLVTSQVSRKTR